MIGLAKDSELDFVRDSSYSLQRLVPRMISYVVCYLLTSDCYLAIYGLDTQGPEEFKTRIFSKQTIGIPAHITRHIDSLGEMVVPFRTPF